MLIHKTRKVFAIWVLTATLAACGGGDGPASEVSQETFPLKAATENYFKSATTEEFTLSGVIGGFVVQGSGTLSEAAPSPATFDGQAALVKLSTVNGSFVLNGTTFPLTASTAAYLTTDYAPLGANDGTYVVVRQPVTVPASARVGDTGPWYVADVYFDSTKSIVLGSLETNWRLDADTASSAILKLTFSSRDVTATVFATSTASFRVLTDGTLTRLSETVEEEGVSMTITY